MFEDKIYSVTDLEFKEIVEGSKSINQVAECLGFKFSPGKISRSRIKDRMTELGIELGMKERIFNPKKESEYPGTNNIGRVGEKYFEYICAKYNISCLREDSCCELYDYIIDINGSLLRIQVKTAEFKETNNIATTFNTTHGNFYNKKNGKMKYNSKDFDYYFLFCIESESGYLYKPKNISDKIRIWDRKPENGITTGVIFGKDIEVSKVLKELKQGNMSLE